MISMFRTRKLTTWFNLWDDNGDGYVDETDILSQTDRLASIRGFDEGSDEHRRVRGTQIELYQGLLAEADTNHDGRLSLEEFLRFYEKAGEALAVGNAEIKESLLSAADAQFDIVDADHDGVASLDEYMSWTRSWRREIDAEAAFRKMDQRGEGTLTKDEIRQIVLDFYFGEDPSAPGTHLVGTIVSE